MSESASLRRFSQTTSYMRALFAYGQRRVADGTAWAAAPPGAF